MEHKIKFSSLTMALWSYTIWSLSICSTLSFFILSLTYFLQLLYLANTKVLSSFPFILALISACIFLPQHTEPCLYTPYLVYCNVKSLFKCYFFMGAFSCSFLLLYFSSYPPCLSYFTFEFCVCPFSTYEFHNDSDFVSFARCRISGKQNIAWHNLLSWWIS